MAERDHDNNDNNLPNEYEDLPGRDEREIIEFYFHKGYQYKHIVLMLDKHHDKKMDVRTLKRRLKDYGLSRREGFDDDHMEHVRSLITREIESGPGSLHGYRSMWHVLRLRYQLNVPRRIVEALVKEVDPNGVSRRKQRCLKRRTYVSAGPNFTWHIDGYDKLKPFGFSIHGCVDGFSRRVLWLEVQRSNKNPRAVAKYFLECVEAAGGCPTRLYTDPGTENGIIAAIQSYLRSDGEDEYSGSRAHKYVPSTSNQRIECYWSFFRKQHSSWWIDFFHDMHQSDILNLTDEIHVEALWFCFADLLQKHLDDVKEFWNTHRIRKSKYSVAHGTPDVMFFLPEEFGRENCLQPFSPNKLHEMNIQLNQMNDGHANGEGPIDPIWEDYFHYVMEQNELMHPDTPLEAGNLFESLVKFAYNGN